MRKFLAFSLIAIVAFVGCRSRQTRQIDYDAQLPPGKLALRKITDPRMIPDFTRACTDTAGMRESVQNSMNYLAKPSSQKFFPYDTVTHAQAVASLQAFTSLLDSGKSPREINQLIRENFDVYISIGCDDRGTVLFTGYYTPIFDASPVRTERFKFPLYKQPPGLTKLPDGRPSQPMPDRRAIDSSGMYAGNELVWMGDKFECYVAHIQGSARLRMPGGQEITVGYTANNGHDYKSVREELVKDGKIEKRAGLPSMIAFFKQNSPLVDEYIYRNPRYIFFAEVKDGRPRGSINEPVITMRSIATDKKIFPPAGVAFVSTMLPQFAGGQIIDVAYQGFACDQDTGGAIRAAGRCDVYMGVGANAGQLAGRAQNEGKLYYLFLKPEKTNNFAGKSGAVIEPQM